MQSSLDKRFCAARHSLACTLNMAAGTQWRDSEDWWTLWTKTLLFHFCLNNRKNLEFQSIEDVVQLLLVCILIWSESLYFSCSSHFCWTLPPPHSVEQHYHSITPLSLLPYSNSLINHITKDLLTKNLHRFLAPSGTTPVPCANKATSPSQISQRWEKVNQCWDLTSSVNEIDA